MGPLTLYWQVVMFFVDLFHLENHDKNDALCQRYCNPRSEQNKWFLKGDVNIHEYVMVNKKVLGQELSQLNDLWFERMGALSSLPLLWK